jgi:hypothetical protein
MPSQSGATQTSRTRGDETYPGRNRAGAPGPRGSDGARGSDEARGPREYHADDRGSRGLRLGGSLSGGLGIAIVAASTALGASTTMIAGKEPGSLLGIFVIVGTVAAAVAVRPQAGRMILPAPALSYLIAALVTGYIYDHSADVSKTALAINAAQWIANGFFAMALATVLAVVLVTVRWVLWRRNRPVPPEDDWSVREPGRRSRPQPAEDDYWGPAAYLDGYGPPGPLDGYGPPGPVDGYGPPGPVDPRPTTATPGAQGTWPGGQRPDQPWPPRTDPRQGRPPAPDPYNFSSGA